MIILMTEANEYVVWLCVRLAISLLNSITILNLKPNYCLILYYEQTGTERLNKLVNNHTAIN